MKAIIIGAGPSGCACGIELVKAGADVVIIDKSTFPRNKTCAGLLTEKTLLLLEENYPNLSFDEIIINKCSDIIIHTGKDSISNINPINRFYITNRYYFDTALLNIYKSLGGITIEGVSVNTINIEENHLILSNGKIVKYDYLIGADGIHSITRRSIDKKLNVVGFCMQSRMKSTYLPTEIHLYYNYIHNGYSWAFPSYESFNIGQITLHRKGVRHKALFDNYINNTVADNTKKNTYGAFIPFTQYIRKPAKDNVLLVGDAAGFTDSFTGEGIYFALKSGIVAACTMLDSDNRKSRKYIKRLKYIRKKVNLGIMLHSLFKNKILNPMIMFVMNKNLRYMTLMIDNMVLKYNYNFLRIIAISIYHLLITILIEFKSKILRSY